MAEPSQVDKSPAGGEGVAAAQSDRVVDPPGDACAHRTEVAGAGDGAQDGAGDRYEAKGEAVPGPGGENGQSEDTRGCLGADMDGKGGTTTAAYSKFLRSA